MSWKWKLAVLAMTLNGVIFAMTFNHLPIRFAFAA
jgi:hypothetical protein